MIGFYINMYGFSFYRFRFFTLINKLNSLEYKLIYFYRIVINTSIFALMNDWVTIAIFTYPHQAALLSSKLEAEGIECYTKDGNTISANPFYSNAIGGVKIQVRENDVEVANKIVKDYYTQINSEEEGEPIPEEEYKAAPIEEASSATEIKCPVCGSEDVHRDNTPSRISLVSVILLGLPLLFPAKKKYHCFNCGADFTPDKVNK
jgi:DNA-directed RNA polymerase subunit RPC12/RpoP